MNKKLDQIRANAIELREQLPNATPEDQEKITKLDKIIHGAVIIKWIYLSAVVFFILYAAVFIYLMCPNVKAMMVLSGITACGFAVSWLCVFIQIKMYDHTLDKMEPALPTG